LFWHLARLQRTVAMVVPTSHPSFPAITFYLSYRWVELQTPLYSVGSYSNVSEPHNVHELYFDHHVWSVAD